MAITHTRVRLLAALALAAAALGLTRGADAQGASPPIRLDPPVFDFGVSHPDEIVDASFTLTNIGTRTLRISGVRAACKCTTPVLPRDTLAPGQSIDIETTVDLRGSIGDAKKDFRVSFDGYAVPVRCVIQGVFAYPVALEPDRIQAPAGTLTLRSTTGRPFRVLSVNGREPEVLAQSPQGSERAVQFTVRYNLLRDRPMPFALVVETDHPDAEVIGMRVYNAATSQQERPYMLNVRQIHVNRPMLPVGRLGPGESTVVDTKLTRRDLTEPATVRVGSDQLSAEIVKIDPVEGSARDEIYHVRITNRSEADRLVLAPLFFRTTGDEGEELLARGWVYGRLTGGPESTETAAGG